MRADSAKPDRRAGSVLGSIFPVAVLGSVSIRTKALGTMYSGSEARRCARSASVPAPVAT